MLQRCQLLWPACRPGLRGAPDMPGALSNAQSAAQLNSDSSAGSHPESQQTVDATGLACPLPILRAKKALATIGSGDVLQVITTDRGAVRDFQAFCRQTGNELLTQIEQEGKVFHYLKRR